MSQAPPEGLEWDSIIEPAVIHGAHRVGLDAYVWPFSVAAGESPRIFVRSSAPFRLRIYRLGWYGGVGAAQLYEQSNLAPRNEKRGCGAESDDPAIANSERDYGLVECDWRDPIVPTLSSAPSGLYMALISASIQGQPYDTMALFVVRDDDATSRAVLVNPTTDQAYNVWSDTPDPKFTDTGFAPLSLYLKTVKGKLWPHASKVAFDRPMAAIPAMLKTDYPLIRFLEREGIPYSVLTDYDVHTNPALLANRRSLVVSGHGEYWTFEVRSALDAFVAAGHNLVAASSNTGFWQVRYEASTRGITPEPVIVGYKELADKAKVKPPCWGQLIVPAGSTTCADPAFTSDYPAVRQRTTSMFRSDVVHLPEQLLFGVQFLFDPPGDGWELPVELFTDVLAAQTSTGAGITDQGPLSIGTPWADKKVGNIGWEADAIYPEVRLRMPGACLKLLGQSTFDPPHLDQRLDAVAHQVLYQRRTGSSPSGYVFAGLSMLWSWGLDDWATLHDLGGPRVSRVNPTLVTLTKNMLNAAERGDFGSDCATPQRLHSFFAASGGTGTELILKEDDAPGRWAKVALHVRNGQVTIVPSALEDAVLSGWAVASDSYNLFVADVNGDGRGDLVANDIDNGDWNVALSDGRGFVPAPQPWSSGIASSAYELFVVDVTGDGKADLVAKERSASGGWWVAVSDGMRFGTPMKWSSDWTVASDGYDLFVVDVTGDRKADLVVKERSGSGNWYVAHSTGSGFAPHSQWLSGWAVSSAAYDLFVADVTGDGKADLVAKERSGGNWDVAISTGTQFHPQSLPWLSSWATATDTYELFVADVNNDRRADLVARERTASGRWFVATNSGGRFVAQPTPALDP